MKLRYEKPTFVKSTVSLQYDSRKVSGITGPAITRG
jgi:hypothetical protein